MLKLELTTKQAVILQIFLIKSTKYRQGEENASKELGRETKEDGTLRYPNLKDNGEWWEEANAILDEIVKKLESL